jgi:hypothetical protein
VPDYVLDHHREGERERLALMSRLLDPLHRRQIEELGIGPGARTLEVGAGNGSVSSVDAFLARCADPAWWTQTIAFSAVRARAPDGLSCSERAPARRTELSRRRA